MRIEHYKPLAGWYICNDDIVGGCVGVGKRIRRNARDEGG